MGEEANKFAAYDTTVSAMWQKLGEAFAAILGEPGEWVETPAQGIVAIQFAVIADACFRQAAIAPELPSVRELLPAPPHA